ncbi:CYTH and CHAD domain-containing protein [Enterovirga rhinocerotis]|uniref:Inorganic triphosphatase YgiF n=1 Tax=Enterovirga rhinocerotis TaxID=1339210 RepID=A0A4R7BWE5_9HYPH|nr:CYTH and CHAD domain-containing protein [Enterovirga rhinocerotis]TDR90190.1 inorganic triphosphatase YgiF [Enterovirga rhinocerotis]
MTSPREIELKLELEPVQPPAPQRPKRGLPPGGETHHLVSRIFDTEDHALQRSGLVLRLRRDGERRIQTLKAAGNGGLLDRVEWETELQGDEPDLDAIPDAAIRAEIAGAGPLAPVLETEFERTCWHLRREGSDLELALDIGAIRAGSASTPIREIEIELKSGSVTSMFDLAREIVAVLPARIGIQSKSERGYRLLSPPKPGAPKARPPELIPGMPAQLAFQAIARSCLTHFRQCEPGILRREVESLHQGRVAIRRLRSAFKLFKPLLDGPETERITRGLRGLFQSFGDARNLDVYLARLAVDGAAPSDLRVQMQRNREAAYDRVIRNLRSKRVRLFMIDLLAFIETGGWQRRSDTAEIRAQRLSVYASKWLDKRWRRLGKSGRHLDRLDVETRHRVRIDGKVFRYAVEFFAGAFPGRKAKKRQRALSDALSALQEALGDLNDIDTAKRMMEAEASSQPDHPAPSEVDEAALVEAACEAHDRIRKTEPFWR